MMRALWVALALLGATTVGAQAAGDKSLGDLMKATALKHMMQGESTACLLMRGEAAQHVVIVRVLRGRLVVMCEIVRAQKESVPTALWRRIAEVNAGPWLARVGYQEGAFYAVAAGMATSMEAKTLRAMITETAALAEKLGPELKDLLQVQ